MADKQQSSSRPYVVQRFPLQSFHAQQVFRRGFDIYTRSIYSLSVISRTNTDEEKIKALEGLIDEKLNNSDADLRKEIAQLTKIAEDNGIAIGTVEYSNLETVEAKISSHRAARYVSLIKEYDSLITGLDALWLSGMIPDRDYSQKIYEWKRRILRISNHVHGATRQLAAESRKENPEKDKQTATSKPAAKEDGSTVPSELSTESQANKSTVVEIATNEGRDNTGIVEGKTKKSLFGW